MSDQKFTDAVQRLRRAVNIHGYKKLLDDMAAAGNEDALTITHVGELAFLQQAQYSPLQEKTYAPVTKDGFTSEMIDAVIAEIEAEIIDLNSQKAKWEILKSNAFKKISAGEKWLQ